MSGIKCSVFVQRYYPDINKRISADLPIKWKQNQELSVLNALQNINDCMQNSGYNLKKAVEIFYKDNVHIINLNRKKLRIKNLPMSGIYKYIIYSKINNVIL